MTTKYTIPSVESILEDSEDESSEELITKGDSADEKYQKSRPVYDTAMKANMAREQEREKERDSDRSRRHRSRKHTSKGKKNIGVKRASGSSREEYEESQLRHRHGRHANRSSSSASSGDEDGREDHRAVLAAARSRLTSPSMVSTFTTQTTATNKSSSSSGSNSTVTQASVKRSSLGKKPEVEEAGEPPMSPAVPDPPNVFQYLEEGLQEKEEEEEEEEEEDERQEADNDEDSEEGEESDHDEIPQWAPTRIKGQYIEASSTSRMIQHASTSSSASSSFHGDDNGSEPAVDVDTDRSSSPERSDDGHDEAPGPPPRDSASAKVASQIAAAQQRQHVHGNMQQFGTPDMPRGNLYLPHVPSSALSARSQYLMQQRPLPRAEKLPVTGYELLASRLSTRPNTENEGRIKPMYRKFEALNHRLLLHLQDELSELEEQLHRLDHADTQSRRTDHPGYIIPASRRLAAQAGGELQWHKTDILGKIGYKLNQYNQALSSFNSTQSLHQPDLEDIEHYRSYLQTEQPIAEAETHFLDPTDDLVSIYSENPAPPSFPSSHAPSSSTSSSEVSSHTSFDSVSSIPPAQLLSTTQPHLQPDLQPILPHLASAIAIAILVPILTFSVIPGFVGRLTVTSLVAVFMVAALVQSGIVQRNWLFGRESCICAGIYGGVMVVLAGIVA